MRKRVIEIRSEDPLIHTATRLPSAMISAIDHLAAQGLTSRSSVIRSMLLAQLQAKGIATLADRVPA